MKKEKVNDNIVLNIPIIVIKFLKTKIKRLANILRKEPIRPTMKYVQKNIDGYNKITGVEIGTASGLHAYNILDTIPQISKLYLIDPYNTYTDGDKKEKNNDNFEEIAIKRLKKFKDRCKFVKKTSSDAFKELNLKNLDFVYIDGNHSYEFVKKDLEMWYNSVKSGGIIGGHDFCIKFPGVPKAVIEFSENKNLKLNGSETDWWIKKK